MTERAPSEIARDTLKMLASRKLLPTPENYMTLYREIAGTPMVLPFPEEPLNQIAKVLPAQNPGQQKQRALFELAVKKRDWVAVQSALVGYCGFGMPAADAGAAPARTSLPAGMLAPLTPEFLAQIARLSEYTLPALGTDDD